jgi:signal transduction histidine kinase
VKALLTRLWPKTLAVRLSLLLIATLAIAQLALTLTLSRERDSLVEELMHSQALNQTVTLARLLDETPDDSARLLQAFGSRNVCAKLSGPPEVRTMSRHESQLADALAGMLHGVDAGAPQVTLGTLDPDAPRCGQKQFYFGREGNIEGHDDDDDDDTAPDGDRLASLLLEVPLRSGQWLTVESLLELSPEPNQLSAISFIVSALAVALVTIWAVRNQTRLLRTLADASERFGRGEKVEPLPTRGPSEVTAATQAFNTMQERLTQFITERMRLLAAVSHDLRTPLTTLRLKAELLSDEEARDDLVTTIEELSGIAEAALAFTRAEADSEPTAELDLAAPVGEVMREFQLAGADVTGERIETVLAPCRPVSLKRAVRNLVENAVRYGGSAHVSVYREGNDAVIDVIDHGPGIPDDRIDDAFKPFVRLEESRNIETGGIGLGLAIALGIVHAHGGTLRLANQPEGGLCARIRLPVSG